jgi:CO/xanthine dehydrogenase Mo-binding subunit
MELVVSQKRYRLLVDPGRSRIVTAYECGAAVNPEHLKTQLEGSIVMGIGGALLEAVEFANGHPTGRCLPSLPMTPRGFVQPL